MSTQPAILLITCDELRRDTLGCYGNRAIDTPHIDALYERGTHFDNAYTTSPWCLPARCSILTGKYPHRSGAYSNFRKCPLDGGLPNLFTELQKASYHTSLFGKCHFAPVPYGETRADKTLPYDEFRDYYVSLGLDHLALQDDKQVSAWFYDDYSKQLDEAGYLTAYRDAIWNRDLQKVFPFPGEAAWHPDAWVGDRAVEYINATGDLPLFAWVSFSGPHYPFDAPEAYVARVRQDQLHPRVLRDGELADERRMHHKDIYGGGNIDGASAAPDRACKNYTDAYWHDLAVQYNANMALIDDKVGEVIAAVQAKYGDNALIIFTADHGEMLGNHGLWGKHNCGYDEVWRIPLLVRFPGGSPDSLAASALANLNDILPTCLAAAGAPPLAGDGESLYGDGPRRRYTFAEGEGYLAVTDGTHKFIQVQKPGEQSQELLDREADPQEFETFLYDPAHQAHLARLRGEAVSFLLPDLLP